MNTRTAEIILGILALGVMSSVYPVLADETPITDPKPLVLPTGSSQDLTQIQTENPLETGGEVGQPTNLQEDINYQPETSAYDTKTQNLNLTLEQKDNNVGDVNRTIRRFPLGDF